MQKKYNDPQIDIIDFKTEEVITASSGGYDIPDEDEFLNKD